MGAMENAGGRDDQRDVRLPLQGHRVPGRAAGSDRAARAGPHVVRRPRDDALVERPVAQRVVRRVGLHDLPVRGHPLDRRLDDLRHPREGLGLPSGPASARPTRSSPRSTTSRTSRSTSTASPTRRAPRCSSSWWPTSGVSRSATACAPYFAKHAWGNTTLDDLLSELEATSGRDLRTWSRCGSRPPGSARCAPSSRSTTAATITSAAIEQTCAPGLETLRPHTLAVGVYAVRDGALRPHRPPRARRRGGAHAVPQLVGREQPDLLLVNDDDLAYAKIRLDERSLATALAYPRGFTTACRAPWCSASLWDMTRDAEMGGPPLRRRRARDSCPVRPTRRCCAPWWPSCRRQ